MNPKPLPGLRIGHATDAEAHTGCTVLLGPFRGACHVGGMATGTRELDVLSPTHLVPGVDAVLLTGGSAFGLSAADGVAAWLEERGAGFDTGAARVPIVPAAVIYDLGVGRPDRRPDPAMGRAACVDAREDNPAEGRVGAGAGATVGKLLGPAHASPGGLGVSHVAAAGYDVVAIAVVNAFGDVLDGNGGILAGVHDGNGTFLGMHGLLLQGGAEGQPTGWRSTPGTNTTLAAVVTDAPLSRIDLERLARMATTAFARRISPVNTPFDGDVVFALSTAAAVRDSTAVELLVLGSAATAALDAAIARAVQPVR